MATIKALDGTVINVPDVCRIKYCTSKTAVRLGEKDTPGNRPRWDLCKAHGVHTKFRYKDAVVVLAVWNDTKVEDYPND